MLPSSAWRICSAEGLLLLASSALVAKIIPGVQKPHCSPCLAQNASCTGSSFPSGATPSIVVPDEPSACAARHVHDFTATPSSITVHEIGKAPSRERE